MFENVVNRKYPRDACSQHRKTEHRFKPNEKLEPQAGGIHA